MDNPLFAWRHMDDFWHNLQQFGLCQVWYIDDNRDIDKNVKKIVKQKTC